MLAFILVKLTHCKRKDKLIFVLHRHQACELAEALAALMGHAHDAAGLDALDEGLETFGSVYELPPPAPPAGRGTSNNQLLHLSTAGTLDGEPDAAGDPGGSNSNLSLNLGEDWCWLSAPRRAQLRLLLAVCWLAECGRGDAALCCGRAVAHCVAGLGLLGLPPPAKVLAAGAVKGGRASICLYVA